MNPFAPNPDVRDMTRWNRAGLDRFRYTSEAAAEFAEALRIAHLLLFEKGQHPDDLDSPDAWRAAFASADGTFADGEALKDALAQLRSRFSRPGMDGVPPRNATYEQRLLAQYQANLMDPSAQISRAFARALHVLAETLNAYANEGTLRTATQTVHAHHLLSLIGFQARLAASAITPISYQVKADAGRVSLGEGLAFDYALPDGGPNLTFEALDAITGHAALNAMRIKGHNSQRDPIAEDTRKFPLQGKSAFSNNLEETIAVLADGESREAVRIQQANEHDGWVLVARSALQTLAGYDQTASLLTTPKTTYAARPRGSDWVHFQKPPSVFPQAIVQVVTAQGYSYYRVQEVRGRDLRISNLSSPWVVSIIDGLGMALETVPSEHSLRILDPGVESPGSGAVVHPDFGITTIGGNQILAVYATVSANKEDPDADTVTPFGFLNLFNLETTSYHLKRGTDLGPLAALASGNIYLDDLKQADIEALPLAVLESDTGLLLATQLEIESSDSDGLVVKALDAGIAAVDVASIHGNFGSQTGFQADTRSRTLVFAAGDSSLTLLCPATEQDLLRPGRVVLLESRSSRDAMEVSIAEVITRDLGRGEVELRIDNRGQDLGLFRKGFTLVHGNVVSFGHGKSLPARVLGSGDGGQANQVMVIEDEAVSTRLNPSFPGGVAADIQVTVEDRIWQQVSTTAGGTDDGPYYSLALQSDNKLAVTFHRLLPTGNDNVQLSRIRVGAGSQGNEIPPYGVNNLQPKNSAVETLVQPLAPQSGADLEGLDALRSEGKSRYTLFGRALGVDDFARLAESHAGVLHAHARLVRQGGGRGGNKILLIVAPNGGTGLDLFEADLVDMLLAASLPGTQIQLRPFYSALLAGRCSVALKSGYADEHKIRGEIEAGLEARFGLPARPLGLRLYASEVAAEIESHVAVKYVTIALEMDCDNDHVSCELNGDLIQAVRPTPDTSVYLAQVSDLALTFEVALDGDR